MRQILHIIHLEVVLVHVQIASSIVTLLHANVEESSSEIVTPKKSAFFQPPHSSWLTSPSSPSFVPHEYFTTPLGSDPDSGDSDDATHHPCHPRQVHLSLGNRQRQPNIDKTSMTISFSIPFRLDQYCHPNNINIYVEYAKRKGNKEGDDDDDNTSLRKYVSARDNDVDDNNGGETTIMRQYNATSPVTNGYYMSDFIYHVPLEHLDPAIYWYSIHVEMKITSPVSTTYPHPSSSSLLLPWEEGEEEGKITAHTKRSLRHQGDSNGASTFESLSSISTKRNTFTTMTTSSSPIQLAILADLGQTYNSTITMLNILSEITSPSSSTSSSSSLSPEQPSVSEMMMLCAGDISYADTLQSQWDNWFVLMEPIISQIPLMVAVGNHEIECDAVTGMPFTAYESRFYMPNRIKEAIIQPVHAHVNNSEYDGKKNGSAWCATPSVFEGDYDFGNAFYSFERGWVKVIVLSSYSDTSRSSEQYKWLRQELTNVNRSHTPWVMVMMHTQFYTPFHAHNNEKETLDMQASMESLFKDNGVNFVFSGHDHAYMRSKPMYKGKVDDSGTSPIYVIVGEGGKGRGRHYMIPDDPEPWVAVRDKSVYGFGLLDVINSTTAHWRWNMHGRDDSFQDDVWFTNQFLF